MHINNLSSVESLKTLMKCHLYLSNLTKRGWVGSTNSQKIIFSANFAVFLRLYASRKKIWIIKKKQPKLANYFSLNYFYSIHGSKKSEITFPSDSSPPLGVRSYLNNPLLSCERKKFIFLLPTHYIKSSLRSLKWPLPAMAALTLSQTQ